MEEEKYEDLLDDNLEKIEKEKKKEIEIKKAQLEFEKFLEEIKPKDDEEEILISEEDKKAKSDLKNIFERLQKDLDNKKYESLNQIYEQYINNEDITKRNIKSNTKRCSLVFMFYIISPLFGIINLIGIFESITIMKVIFKVVKNSIVVYFNSLKKDQSGNEPFSIDDFNNQYNFYHLFFSDIKKESFDFNLMMFTGFLGDIILKSTGFIVSTIICTLINAVSIFLILGFSFSSYYSEDNTYSFLQILHLLLSWIILLVGVGASSLLSQKIIIDSNSKYNDYLIEFNKSTEKKWKQTKKKWEKQKKETNEEKTNKKEIIIEELAEMKEKDIFEEEKNEEKDKQIEKFDEEKENEGKLKINTNEISEKYGKEIVIEVNQEKEDNDLIKLKHMFDNIQEIQKEPEDFKRTKTIYLKESNNENDKRAQSFSFINRNSKKEGEEKKEEEVEKIKKAKKGNKFDSFFMICITTIIGYFFKYFLNVIIMENNEKNNEKYKIFVGCGDDSCYNNIIFDRNLSISDNKLFEDLKNKIYKDEYNSFFAVIILYVSCIVISIILYLIFVMIFTKNEKRNDKPGNQYRVYELCGYTIYSEQTILNNNIPCCECCNLICKTTKNCLCMVTQSFIFDFCDCFEDCELRGSFYDDNLEENVYFLCCKCRKYKTEEYKKNKECFCYCYQTKRKQTWLNQFLTSDIQKKVFPYMIEYFILKILILAFEKQYLEFGNLNNRPQILNDTNNTNYWSIMDNYYFSKENNITNIYDKGINIFMVEDIYTYLTFIITFFLYFYFTLTYNNIITNNTSELLENKRVGISKLSNDILSGIHGILIFEGLFSLIFSSLYLSKSENFLFENANLFLVPILMNKFYYFTLIYYCISYSERKKFDLISGSTLISIYLFIWETITSLIRDYMSLNALFIMQIVLSVFPCFCIAVPILALLVVTINPCYPCYHKLALCFYFLSYAICFGGFWMTDSIFRGSSDFFSKLFDSILHCKCNCEYTNECNCNCDCCEDCGYCCFDFLNFFCCFDIC